MDKYNPFAEYRKQLAEKKKKEKFKKAPSIIPFPTVVNVQNQQDVSDKQENTTSSIKDNASPFDQIRHEDKDGEYWLARELQQLLGYDKWQNFERAIKKATENFETVGIDASDLITEISKQVPRGSGAMPQTIKDYRLTRRACYTVAVCCDINKPEVAAAKQYFVIRTRQAEVQQQATIPVMSTMEMISTIALHVDKVEKEQKRQADILLQQQEQQQELTATSEEHDRRLTLLEEQNRTVIPAQPVSIRYRTIQALQYRLNNNDIMTYQESKQLAYDVISKQYNIDLDIELQVWKDSFTRYYNKQIVDRGYHNVPKNVLCPAQIRDLSWVKLISTNNEWYKTVKSAYERLIS